MKRDVGEGPFTARNWTWDRYMRRIHGAAEDSADAEGRTYSLIIPLGPWVCPRQRGADPCDCPDCRRTITCR